jgi:nickel-dependent lactate racemase
MTISTSSPSSSVFGRGCDRGCLPDREVEEIVVEGLAALQVDGRRVLVVIPDGTRSMPMPLFFDILNRHLGPRVAAMDFLVALGTHPPMSDAQLSRLMGSPVLDGCVGGSRISNHSWDRPDSFVHLGTISAAETASLTGGLLEQEILVRLNRLVLDYDHMLICGPVFPHEVAGFSGGVKYFFPGIAGPEIIHLTHWLGALLTSMEIIGTRETAVRRVMNRAVEFLDRPHSLIAPVVTKEGIAGIYCGPTREAWREAAQLSDRRHIVWLERPCARVLAVMPTMYSDLWTGAKGMYKVEPAVADGGEVVIYAPHISEVSYVHGEWLDRIGYHCRDYFLKQWDRFRDCPGGVLAHSTHLKGKGSYDAATGVEIPRIHVTLATAISEERSRRINLGYLNPATVDVEEWLQSKDTLVVPHAGEMLYRLGRPTSAE